MSKKLLQKKGQKNRKGQTNFVDLKTAELLYVEL
jgi:hypothetical protein